MLAKLKGALSGRRHFLATESSLKIVKNYFYFTLKTFFVIKIFKFLFQIFGHVEKRLDYKDKVKFKINDVTTRLTNKINTLIAQHLKK